MYLVLYTACHQQATDLKPAVPSMHSGGSDMVNRLTVMVLVSSLLLPTNARQRPRVMMSLVLVGELLLTMS